MNPSPRSAFINSGPWALGWVLAAKESNGWDTTQVLVTQSCLTLCHPRTVAHQAPPSVGILQARILEWAAIPFSRGSSWPRNATWVSCIAGRFFTVWATSEAQRAQANSSSGEKQEGSQCQGSCPGWLSGLAWEIQLQESQNPSILAPAEGKAWNKGHTTPSWGRSVWGRKAFE